METMPANVNTRVATDNALFDVLGGHVTLPDDWIVFGHGAR